MKFRVSQYFPAQQALFPELCKSGEAIVESASFGGQAPAPWILAIGGVSVQVDATCVDCCFSYSFTINDLYDFDIKGVPGFTSRSAKGEAATIGVNIVDTVLDCEWESFYHKITSGKLRTF